MRDSVKKRSQNLIRREESPRGLAHTCGRRRRTTDDMSSLPPDLGQYPSDRLSELGMEPLTASHDVKPQVFAQTRCRGERLDVPQLVVQDRLPQAPPVSLSGVGQHGYIVLEHSPPAPPTSCRLGSGVPSGSFSAPGLQSAPLAATTQPPGFNSFAGSPAIPVGFGRPAAASTLSPLSAPPMGYQHRGSIASPGWPGAPLAAPIPPASNLCAGSSAVSPGSRLPIPLPVPMPFPYQYGGSQLSQLPVPPIPGGAMFCPTGAN